MTIKIAHLGPQGTNAETAAVTYQTWLAREHNQQVELLSCQSIAQSAYALAQNDVELAVLPIENSVQGSVAVSLDLVWELHPLSIRHQIILPIHHCLISFAPDLTQIKTVYSHPQALAQCQSWLEQNIGHAPLVDTKSTTAMLEHLAAQPDIAAIASPRAAKVYNLPVLAEAINDAPNNCTRFWVLGKDHHTEGKILSLAFTLPAEQPGVLVAALAVFARRKINLIRIESRPTKRSLGEYLFFVDLEGSLRELPLQNALDELRQQTDVLKILGNYTTISDSILA